MQGVPASDRNDSIAACVTPTTLGPEKCIVFTRLRELLFPTLVISIIASLWFVGRAQEMEDDIRNGVGPHPRWTALVDSQPTIAE